MSVPISSVGLTTTERVILGRRVADALPEEVERLGASRVFVLCSRSLNRNTDEIEQVRRALGSKLVGVYDGMPPHAPRSAVLEAAAQARAAGCDLIVGIGGGSIIDAGKIVAMCLEHDLREHDEMEPFHVFVNEQGQVIKPSIRGPKIRVINVPTTLSGGEFNALSGATDEKIKHKQGYEHPMMAPVSVILDPALGLHTPEWLWLSTGVRSVDHALETLGSFESNDFCDGMAECALRLLAEGMPRVKANPHDLEARLKCQIGVWQSMIPIIGGTPMGASHAIGHILGGTCDVPHGYCSCVMAPYVLAFNEPVNGDRQKRISAAFGQPGKRASDVVDAFIRGLGMPRRLSDVGVGEDRLQQVAEYTMMDLWARTNPRTISGPDDVMQILRLAA
jgi:alcohol dehydrogenase class IV